MSKRTLSALLFMFVVVLAAACGPSTAATPTKKAATAVAPEAATQEVTSEATVEATKEATVEATSEATTEATTEATKEATVEATVETTMEATVEAAPAEVTAEATHEVAVVPTTEATVEATMEATVEVTTDVKATTDAAATDTMATSNAAMMVATNAQATTDAAMAEATSEMATGTAMMAATSDMATTNAVAMAAATNDMASATAMMAATMAAEATTEVTTEATTEVTMEATVEPTPMPEATTEATTEATSEATTEAGGLIPIRLQLQWVAQSQFAGYYAAVDQGYYKDEGLDVSILEGAVDIVPQQVVAAGGAEFGIAWVPKMLASREQGADLVDIAQIFQRSGTLEVSFADKGITSVADLKGRKVGTWGFGNEHELFAALRTITGVDPTNNVGVNIVQQPFDMSLLLNGDVDAAEAMTYNEYAQVLEQTNPATGKLYQPDELNVINFNDVGTAMLQDEIFSLGSWLKGTTNGVSNEDIAVKFIRASLKGWIYARDHFSEAVDIVLKNGPTLGKGHQTWQLNEINKLIWPSPDGIGVVDQALWDQTVKVALDGKVITAEPTDGAFRNDLVQKALDSLTADGVDVKGTDYKPQTVEITPKGE